VGCRRESSPAPRTTAHSTRGRTRQRGRRAVRAANRDLVRNSQPKRSTSHSPVPLTPDQLYRVLQCQCQRAAPFRLAPSQSSSKRVLPPMAWHPARIKSGQDSRSQCCTKQAPTGPFTIRTLQPPTPFTTVLHSTSSVAPVNRLLQCCSAFMRTTSHKPFAFPHPFRDTKSQPSQSHKPHIA